MIRICPNPLTWNQIFQQLETFAIEHPSLSPPPKPLILSGWAFTNDYEKKHRWDLTVDWVRNAGCAHLLSDLKDDDYYYSEELSNYAVSPMGGPMYRPWDFEEKNRPSSQIADEAFQKLKASWSRIAGETAEITSPIDFSGSKLRRLIVLVEGDALPPWGSWTTLTNDESKRRSFTRLRAAINATISPHEIDHIDFILKPK